MSNKLTEFQNVVVGVAAAFVEAVILQPTLYWKNAKAAKLPFTLNPKIIYRGTSASIFNECQMMGLQFGTTGYFQKVVSENGKFELTQRQQITTAALGGFLTAFFTSPIEMVMIQQQRFGGSFIQTPLNVIKSYGFGPKGLMRGLIPTMMRDSIYVVGLLGITPVIQELLMKEYHLPSAQAGLYASLVGGVAAAIPSHPFDIVKTCMQGDLDRKQYMTFSHTFRTLFNEVRAGRGGP